MATKPYLELRSLSNAQRLALEIGGIKSFDALLLNSPVEISKKAKISLNEVQLIIRRACEELSSPGLGLSSLSSRENGQCVFTTGDKILDQTIGGGMRTGMVWEFAGEGASGKTQLALQLSLFVQLPKELGGLCGSACYLSTFSSLPTRRVQQLIDEHPGLSKESCSMSDIHSCYTPTTQVLMRVLTAHLPDLLKRCKDDQSRKSIRLLVLDSISELYRSGPDRNANSLFERSRELHELSNMLHQLCAEHDIAVVVINGVTDIFNHEHPPPTNPGDSVPYRQQSQWFSRAHSMPAEHLKEVGLGLVWANQVNVRIMFTRTSRRRLTDNSGLPEKRMRMQDGGMALSVRNSDREDDRDEDSQSSVLIRRLSVVFSSVSPPSSIDYIVAKDGISAASETYTPTLENGVQTSQSNRVPIAVAVDEGITARDSVSKYANSLNDGDLEDEDDMYWNLFDDIQEDLLPDTEESIVEGSGYNVKVDEETAIEC